MIGYIKDPLYDRHLFMNERDCIVDLYASILVNKFYAATAIFTQDNAGKVLKLAGVWGYKTVGNYFIFYLDDGGFRKMVLTTNTGAIVSSGYVSQSSTQWTEPFLWTYNPAYGLFAFRGYTGKCKLCIAVYRL